MLHICWHLPSLYVVAASGCIPVNLSTAKKEHQWGIPHFPVWKQNQEEIQSYKFLRKI